jgi:hypothetical protein
MLRFSNDDYALPINGSKEKELNGAGYAPD